MNRLLCLLLGHGETTLIQDGRGAAWHRCDRCRAVVGAHSWHGGRPWELAGRYPVHCNCPVKSAPGAVHFANCAISQRDWIERGRL